MEKMEARRHEESAKPYDARGPYDVDYGRIIHSSSFRRLQGKTQILNLGDSDFYRTRLTHTLEVAQIGVGLLLQLRKKFESQESRKRALPDAALMHSICLVHDLGHPPFGHGGEVALNYCMRSKGGFEGNAQTLRILTKLEKFSEANGSNLTRRCLLGVLKYPVAFSVAFNPALSPCLHNLSAVKIVDSALSAPPKCYFDDEDDVVHWLSEPFATEDKSRFKTVRSEAGKHTKAIHKSFDCTIMDLADDIAYGVHDLEDAIAIRMIRRQEIEASLSEADCRDFLDTYFDKSVPSARYKEFLDWLFGDSHHRKRAISRLVGYFVNSVETRVDETFSHDLLRLSVYLPDPKADLLKGLKEVVYINVINSPEVRHLEAKGQHMVVAVFEALCAEPHRFLSLEDRRRYEAAQSADRLVCDYIAGMTDAHLMLFYERLYSPRMGSIFDRL